MRVHPSLSFLGLVAILSIGSGARARADVPPRDDKPRPPTGPVPPVRPIPPERPTPPAPPTPPVPPTPPAPPTPPTPAESEMQGPPRAREPFTNVFMKSMIGTWDLAIHGMEGDTKGTAIISLALDGTAVVEEFTDDHGFSNLSVYQVSSDGKTVQSAWFNTTGGGQMWPMSGPLTEKGFDLAGEGMGGGTASARLYAGEAGMTFELKMASAPKAEEVTVATIRYTKAAKAAERPAIAREKGAKASFIDDVLGAWKVEGVTKLDFMGGMEIASSGTSAFRLGVGGAYLLQDYDVRNPMQHLVMFGVMSFGADGKSGHAWWFTNLEGPMRDFSIAAEDAGWKFSRTSTHGSATSTWTKKDGALKSAAAIVLPGDRKLSVEETYTR